MTICFLLTHIPNPRINKRIDIFKDVYNTKVICTRRASQNIWEPVKDIEHVVFDIDLPSSKHIVKRYIVSQGFQKKALEKLNEIKPDIIYVEGLDPLIIASKYKKKNGCKIIFEVADLRENYIEKPNGFVPRIITNFILKKEKKSFKNVNKLVVTSPKFYELHYKDLISKNKMIYIPNSPDTDVFRNYIKKNNGEFTVGFIGGIRYLTQMKMLVDAADSIGFRVLFAGAGGTTSDMEEIKHYCTKMENVSFSGRYDYDSEIADIYGKVDCVYAVYDADNPNVRIALPNKLYESIICELPIIVASGTYLSELVEKWGVGVSISHKSLQQLNNVIQKLRNDSKYYNSIVENCRKIKQNIIELDWKKELKKFVEQQ